MAHELRYERIKIREVRFCTKHSQGERYHALLKEDRTWAIVAKTLPEPINQIRVLLNAQLNQALADFLRFECDCWELVSMSQHTFIRGASWASVEIVDDIAVLSDLVDEPVWEEE